MSNPYQISEKQNSAYMNPQMQQGYSVCQPLADKAGWMQFFGWGLLIYGCLVSIFIITAIFGIPLAIMGFNLKEAGSKYRLGTPSNPQLQFEASQNLGRFFLIGGILFAVWLVLMLLYFVLWLTILMFAVVAAQ